jgi:hypothetical protein
VQRFHTYDKGSMKLLTINHIAHRGRKVLARCQGQQMQDLRIRSKEVQQATWHASTLASGCSHASPADSLTCMLGGLSGSSTEQ